MATILSYSLKVWWRLLKTACNAIQLICKWFEACSIWIELFSNIFPYVICTNNMYNNRKRLFSYRQVEVADQKQGMCYLAWIWLHQFVENFFQEFLPFFFIFVYLVVLYGCPISIKCTIVQLEVDQLSEASWHILLHGMNKI